MKKKSKILKIVERIFIIVAVITITAFAVKAADNFINKNKNDNSRCPSGMVVVSSARGEFCIDKYESSPGKLCPVSVPINQDDSRKNLEVIDCQPISEANKSPWINISQDQAELACAKAGKRLPTSREWYEAALGTPDQSESWNQDDCQVNKNWANQPGFTGSGKNCVSGVGAYDMVGNVWEWVKGTIKEGKIDNQELPKDGYIDSMDGDNLPGQTNPEKPNPNYNNDYFWIKSTGLRAIARGGYWDNKTDAGQYSVYIVLSPSTVGAGIGFRCVK